ncbi:MAG: bifunctional acetate--CoA ligase family protein/GNAT family N-acetyltransferase [Saprospirales bacterium]|nr:bifunctional acetate--CoA ligase family protein/GNAT family N-acetyltransferase [Saprospirales bacterium]
MRAQLEKLFNPKSIAAIGASDRKGSVGYVLIRNLLSGSYGGKVYPVNIQHDTIHGRPAFKSIKNVPETVDLVIIATPAETVPEVVEQCGKAGVEAAVILSSGFIEVGGEGSKRFEKIKKIAAKYKIRILGPNCIGFINPLLGLNATFLNQKVLPGRIVLISQSGALGSSVLDWAAEQNVGFSHFVSVGSMIDIGFHDLIDYFGMDSHTSSILIYMESLKDARRFMSAARAFSHSKPIIVLKAGKSLEGAQATLSHTGTLAGNDAAFSAAFHRAGVVRVNTIAQLFHSAQAMAMQPRPDDNRLAIITNAGGPGVLATDFLIHKGGRLAKLSKETIQKLNEVLPADWSKSNPIDILGDATPERYSQALSLALEDRGVDGILVILAPQGISSPDEVARAVGKISHRSRKPILATWMGEKEVQTARDILENEKVPNYRYPESAIEVFLFMCSYTLNQQLLHETPMEIPRSFTPDKAEAQRLIDKALGEERDSLSEAEAKALLATFEIPVIESHLVTSETGAANAAREMGFPVVMKAELNASVHKSDFGGVKYPIHNANQARMAFTELVEAARTHHSDKVVRGVLVEPYTEKRYELIIGARKDPIFGPIILFGMGGVAVEIFLDRNVGLPPLNMALAKGLIEGTKIYQLLKGYRESKGIDLAAIQFVLYKFAYLVMDFPEITEIEINPFAVDEYGGVVLDAKVHLEKPKFNKRRQPYAHLVISPYPAQYSRRVTLKNGQTALLRAIRPEDEPLEAEMFTVLSKETVYFRFFGYVPHVTHELLTRFTQIDYDREMAIIAEIQETPDGPPRMAGVVRLVGDAWNENAEYAIVVADPWQGQGLGSKMTDFSLEIARERDIRKIYASVLSNNEGMIGIFERKGFTFRQEGYDAYYVELDLEKTAAAAEIS